MCCDGLKGLPDAIRTTWPQADVQTCVVHLVRNSLRYASKKHWGQITKAMRAIYTAPTLEAATDLFQDFSDEWREKYPAMIRSWENAWDEFTPFLAFPTEIRKIVYTTNSIESLNSRFRRAVRHRGHFPTEQAAMKVLYLVATARRKNIARNVDIRSFATNMRCALGRIRTFDTRFRKPARTCFVVSRQLSLSAESSMFAGIPGVLADASLSSFLVVSQPVTDR